MCNVKLNFYLSTYFQRIEYEKYIDINCPYLTLKTNYRVPTRGRAVRIVGLTGEPIVLDRRVRKHGRLKIVVKKLDFKEQLQTALTLLDTNFDLMSAHQAYKQDPSRPQPVYPNLAIPCRDRRDFQAGNWSRFSLIWMIYISK